MNEKILIVEDNPASQRLLEMALRPKDYILLKAADGAEALDMALREHPDLILLDVRLPGMDGLEVARRLRHNPAFNQMPIICVTAYAMMGDQEKALNAGCDVYLAKPIDTRKLPELVAEMLRRPQKKMSE
jgi:two-component system cell cycle response regulator DivK